MAVDALGLCLDEYVLLIRAEDVTVNGIETDVALGVGAVKEDICLLACAEAVSHDLASVRRQLRIALAIGQRRHTSYAACCKLSACEGLKGEGRLRRSGSCGRCRNDK